MSESNFDELKPTTPDAAEKTMAETRLQSSQLMDRMIEKVPQAGRFFGKFGFRKASTFTDEHVFGIKTFDNRVILLTDEQAVGNTTVFTAITGAGPRQIKVTNPEQIQMIRQEIQERLIPLQVGKTTSIQKLEAEEEKRMTDISNKGIPLNEGILDPRGTTIQIGTYIFSVNNGSLIDNPPGQSVEDAITRSIAKAKQADANLIIKGVLRAERRTRAAIGVAADVLEDS